MSAYFTMLRLFPTFTSIMTIKRIVFLAFILCFLSGMVHADSGADAILGHWISTRNNVKVQVYKEGSEFKARVTWFKDTDDKSKPMETRKDENNPDPKLRQRKVLGMQVLSQLRYNTKSKRWENGKIYDAKTGRTWSSVAYLSDDGLLNVKGYWQFEFIGKTMRFRKIG